MSNPSSPCSASSQETQLAHPQNPATTPTVGHTTMSSNTTIVGTNLISLNASSQIPFKLGKDGANYASWKSQMTNLLFGYDLLGFVDGSHPCPPPVDSAYHLWLRQDRLVLLVLLSIIIKLQQLPGTSFKQAMPTDLTHGC
ncbi:hypothetical protein PVL29_007894 [Vitis rotundifolia]|uniref:Retrotransposon Copia-like N-terminal domain-containing protein n=1 Tax=Vitis rotundifolia TaxID=103349 RepID=A0AA39A244_VITRO|nr:hypothetical protein PVL29_007894 [Vitis rotundifolia]